MPPKMMKGQEYPWKKNNNLQTLFKLPSTCSIHIAEAMGILLAIKFINKNKKYIIRSYSLTSIISVENKFNPSDIAIQIQNRLEEAKNKNNNIILIWIPNTYEQAAMKGQINKPNFLPAQMRTIHQHITVHRTDKTKHNLPMAKTYGSKQTKPNQTNSKKMGNKP